MNLCEYLSPERIVFLKSRNKIDAIRELVETTCSSIPELNAENIFQAVLARESVVSSWVAPGIAIPHGRLPGLNKFILALGRSFEGVEYELGDGKPVYLIILILGDTRDVDRHIALMAEAARALGTDAIKEMILKTRSRNDIYNIIKCRGEVAAETREGGLDELTREDLNILIVNHALLLSGQVKAKALIIHLDSLTDMTFINKIPQNIKIILVTQQKDPFWGKSMIPHPIIQVPFPGLSRQNQVALTLLFALSQGLIEKDDRVVGIFGVPDSKTLDTLMVIDVMKEVPTYLPSHSTDLFECSEPKVLERVLQLAAELSQEGREGRPVGATFVLGDYDHVKDFSQQMIINPFRGYKDEEKSILDPHLEETVKEFSTIDGAFLIRGDGVIQAAGAYLQAGKVETLLPSGLGARHAAAAAITAYTQAISVVVSQSTGRVSMFKEGKLIMSLEKAGV
ncbi:MAG: diadenylate cyclase [Spirochaetota bacterium]